jgi:hypothetical protein
MSYLAITFLAILSTCHCRRSEKYGMQGEIDSLRETSPPLRWGRVNPNLRKIEQRRNEDGAYTFTFPSGHANTKYLAEAKDRLETSRPRLSNQP